MAFAEKIIYLFLRQPFPVEFRLDTTGSIAVIFKTSCINGWGVLALP
jgi:hypothetical protein